jgi:hypothetical protein
MMKLLTAVRIYWVAAAMLLIGWCINLYQALSRPTVDWRQAAGMPSLAMILIVLTLLTQARRKLSEEPTARAGAVVARYMVAGLALMGLIGIVVLGLLATR